jgi:hypothetical protein
MTAYAITLLSLPAVVRVRTAATTSAIRRSLTGSPGRGEPMPTRPHASDKTDRVSVTTAPQSWCAAVLTPLALARRVATAPLPISSPTSMAAQMAAVPQRRRAIASIRARSDGARRAAAAGRRAGADRGRAAAAAGPGGALPGALLRPRLRGGEGDGKTATRAAAIARASGSESEET